MMMLDLFSGIGGFHKGFEQAGYTFDWVGFSEIDKYANAVYKHKFPKAEELGDIKLIQPGRDLPDHIDILCGGFPCQAFSVAGKRKGFDDTRGTLFFEIARILRHYKDSGNPISCLVLENVKGLLSHDNGRTFAVIYRILSDLGYTIEFQLLNTRWWLPQNRERIYIVGYIGDRGGPQVFPIGEPGGISDNRNAKVASTLQHPGHSGGNYKGMTMILDPKYARMEGKMREYEEHSPTLNGRDYKEPNLVQIGTIGKDSEATRVYDANGISRTIKDGGGMGAKTGLYKVGDLKITAKKRRHDTPKEINEYLKANKNGKTIREIAESLDLPKTQVEHYFRSDKSRAIPSPDHWLLLKKLLGFDNTFDKEVTDIYEKEVEFESSRRVYSVDGISKTLDTNDNGYYKVPEATKKGYAEAEEGDSINLSVPNSKTRRGRVGKGEAQTLDTGMQQYTIQPKILDDYNSKIREDGVTPTLTQNCGAKARRNGMKLLEDTNIRRLTPVECNRLQGFSDDHNKYGEMDGKVVEMSDTQRYKQAGNAVTVDVVQAVAERIRPLFEDNKRV